MKPPKFLHKMKMFIRRNKWASGEWNEAKEQFLKRRKLKQPTEKDWK